MLDCAIIVPARLGSQRFPRKLLEPVRGRPLILWTAANLRRIAPQLPLYFAVAEAELAAVLAAEGHASVMTDPGLPSGTDRLAAANRQIGAHRVINVQADEPVLAADHIRQLLQLMETGVDMATLATPFTRLEDFRDPNKVKAVIRPDGEALYFSRAPVPYPRDAADALPPGAYWHMGIYGYSAGLLEAFSDWQPGRLEQVERLEQLRVLENGRRIGVGITATRTVGVDVPGDIAELERFLADA
jgi:3-deoxy-manno-octulosonate cytidylyltransferase (CMP-KDO synthetase)